MLAGDLRSPRARRLGAASWPRSAVQVTLVDGSRLDLEHDSELHLASSRTPRARLTRGSLLVEIIRKPAAHAAFALNGFVLELAPGKFALRAERDAARRPSSIVSARRPFGEVPSCTRRRVCVRS